uniref:Uncharacterized protein n=1 Tax=Apteryx owenii TaxID=8824 RepID=A0A8B9QKI9_APTOW
MLEARCSGRSPGAAASPPPPAAPAGFSVDSGRGLTRRSELSFVSGAPRANHTGAVVILRRDSANRLVPEAVLPGEQLSSSFGYAVAVLDLNSDGCARRRGGGAAGMGWGGAALGLTRPLRPQLDGPGGGGPALLRAPAGARGGRLRLRQPGGPLGVRHPAPPHRRLRLHVRHRPQRRRRPRPGRLQR